MDSEATMLWNNMGLETITFQNLNGSGKKILPNYYENSFLRKDLRNKYLKQLYNRMLRQLQKEMVNDQEKQSILPNKKNNQNSTPWEVYLILERVTEDH